MNRLARSAGPALLLAAAALIAAASAACRGGDLTKSADQALAEQQAKEDSDRAASEEAAAKPEPKPEPKVNEALYVEITARAVLLREKYPDAPDQAEEEIGKVCETLGLTMTDYKDYAKTLDPAQSGPLQKNVQDRIQVLAPQYR